MSRVAGRLSYANVMATLAVFLALGGGITLAAISGDGSVRFGADRGLPVAEWSTLLTLPGTGKVQVNCSKGFTDIRFRNTSGGTLQASVVRAGDGAYAAASLAQNEALETFAGASVEAELIDTLRFHVFRASARGNPTAEITVSHQYGVGGCENRAVSAQALASE